MAPSREPSRGYSHPIGDAILTILDEDPLSAGEIAQEVDFPQEKIYYHLKNLLARNLIYVAETEVVNGITKKRFLKGGEETTDESSSGGDEVKERGTISSEAGDDNGETSHGGGEEESIETSDEDDEPITESMAESDEDTTDSSGSDLSEEERAALEKPQPVASSAEQPAKEGAGAAEGSILNKLLSGRPKALPQDKEPYFEETASDELLTRTVTVEDVVFLIPDAGNTLAGIDYMVRSAKREDGREISLHDKQLLADHLEYLRIGAEEAEGEPMREFATEEIQDEAKRDEAEKPKAKGWGLYLHRRLSGYFNAVTFVQIENRVRYLRASINRRGFLILDQSIYHLPFQENGETIDDLPKLIKHVYSEKVKRKHWRKLYLAYFSNKYSFDIDPLKTPDMKGSELEAFIKTSICKRFALEPDGAIVNWLEYKTPSADPQKQFIVSVGDKSPIQRDYEALVESKIQPRFTTSIAKIQYDLYRYNFPEDGGNVILVYIGAHRSIITIVNDWEIKDSRSSVVSADDFVDVSIEADTVENGDGGEGNGKESRDLKPTDMASALREVDVRRDKKGRATFEKLESEIYATIKYFKGRGYYLSNEILISGMGTNLPNIEQYISEDFDKQVSKLVLPEKVQYAGKVSALAGEDFSINLGLLLDPKDRLNLLPIEQRVNAKFIFPLHLGKIVGAALILLGTFLSTTNYFNSIRLDSELNSKRTELATLTQQNDIFYDISYKLAVTELIHGTKAYDEYISAKVLEVLKFLTTTLSDAILLDQVIFTKGEDGKKPMLTLMGRISSSGAESNIVLNNMMFYLRDYEMLKKVSLREQGGSGSGTLSFTVDLDL